MRRTRLAKRAAFTLVELLVVIAIIGVLVALLLPAVQSARASAERTTCANHLKQLALAFQLHEGAHGFLPSAGGPDWTYHMTYIDGAPAVAPDQHGGWGFQVLPYMEAEAVWSGQGATTDIDRSIQAISTPHQIMFCPSRRAPEVVEAVDWYHHPNTGRTYGHAKNDYAACCHDEDVRASHVDPNVEGDRRLFLDAKGVGAILKLDGLQLGRITDGTSKTLLLAEKRMNVKLLGQMQANDNEGYTCGWNHDILRFITRSPRPDFVHDSSPGDDRFGSSHPGGLNAALADGSVTYLSYSIDIRTYVLLGVRNDGEVTEPNE